MADPPSRLAAALAERYHLERELGQGGMATVYLAEDLKHHRKVALKVLRPELAATLGPERFFREIEVAAQQSGRRVTDWTSDGRRFFFVLSHHEGDVPTAGGADDNPRDGQCRHGHKPQTTRR